MHLTKTLLVLVIANLNNTTIGHAPSIIGILVFSYSHLI